jgi:hypothetical protein
MRAGRSRRARSSRCGGSAMFLSKHMTLHDAWQVVNERTNSTGRGPIWQALKEGAVSAELWRGGQLKWDPVPADWWNDADNFNWPVSPYGLLPNLPDASMFRVERRIIDGLWPASELPASAETDHSGAPGRPSSAHLVSAEFTRRRQSGAIEGTLAAQAVALEEWLKATHPNRAPMTAGTIENRIRPAWNSIPRK